MVIRPRGRPVSFERCENKVRVKHGERHCVIVDIPSPQEFDSSGIAFLNLSWDAVIDLVLNLDDFESFVTDDEVTDKYWERGQRPLSTALTLAQQGAEFLLKARIAAVSPFLLIAAGPREWPGNCDSRDCAYSNFRTIDAQDLVRVHDAVAMKRLGADFKRAFEEMRRTRNSLMHSVSKGRRFSAGHVLGWILRVARELADGRSWPAYRRQYLEDGAPVGALSHEGVGSRVVREIMATVGLLSPSDCKKLLGVNKQARFYRCMACYDSDYSDQPKAAQLRPNDAASTHVFCHACEATRVVRRIRCRACRGNVIDEDDTCLTCGDVQGST